MAQNKNEAWPHFEQSYLENMDSVLFEKNSPALFPKPSIVLFNEALAQDLGLESHFLNRPEMAPYLCGSKIFPTSEPFSMAYAGHQYAHFTILGDGRAHVLGELLSPQGKRYDWQLKGSGESRYSRGNDGRAVLGPMLREYIVSEFLAAAQVPTTRSLAVCLTGEEVYRNVTFPGAVLSRIATSHVRVGTFQFVSIQKNPALLKSFCDYNIQRHAPDCFKQANPYVSFFEEVALRQAKLIAQWMSLGFVHGVMNTDNMSISGESIDFGPCAFLDYYEPGLSFSSIDRQARYSYINQPNIAGWNLARLAETLLPLFDANESKAIDQAKVVLEKFQTTYTEEYQRLMCQKLGFPKVTSENFKMLEDFLKLLEQTQADFSYTFRSLSRDANVQESLQNMPQFLDWKKSWSAALANRKTEAQELMLKRNPAVIPRNYWVEEALNAANNLKFEALHKLLHDLQKPFDVSSDSLKLAEPPPTGKEPFVTFCGT